jgi:hypothetical protein
VQQNKIDQRALEEIGLLTSPTPKLQFKQCQVNEFQRKIKHLLDLEILEIKREY